MSALSNYLEGEIVEYFLRSQTAAQPGQLYLALFTSNPSDAGGGTEVSYGAYERKAIDFTTYDSGTGKTKNTALIQFAANDGIQVTVTGAAVFDALNNGNMFLWGGLAANKILDTNDVLSFAQEALELTLD